ncbi:MAG: helix-turn-helix domain-containing protein [Maribacter sp.]|uniref:helix-turn-helix domain-containing protein n=1 Tax=Maribacter sp. TaxID=1897614 RepID=UPI0032973604
MWKTNLIWVILYIAFVPPIFGQDSFEDKTLEEIDKLTLAAWRNGDIQKSRIYADYQIEKAKKLKDSLAIAFAFYTYMYSENFEEALNYCDSTIIFTKNSKNKFYPTLGYLVKGKIYKQKKMFKLALDNLLIADSLAKVKQNIAQQSSVKQVIANIYSHLGKYEEALEMHKKYYLQKSEYGGENWEISRNHTIALYNLSLSYLKVKKRDSARLFYQYAANKAEQANFHDFYTSKLVSIHAQIDFYDKRYDSALDTLRKYRFDNSGNWLANNYYYSGKIHRFKNNNDKAIEFFTKMDSMLTADKEPFFHAKDGLAELSNIFKELGDSENQLKYINRYLWVDSILIEQKETIDPLIVNKYQKPIMLEEKRKLLDQASRKQVLLNYLYVTLGAFVSVGVYFGIKSREHSRRIQYLIENGIPTSSASSIRNKTPNSIPEEVAELLTRGLDEFENAKLFLDKELTLSNLAKQFDTNSTYLSKYINEKKGENFPSYIKGLRIKYAIEALKENPGLLKFNIKGLASEFGFQTPDAFSRAFQKETNVKPSQFIKQLRKL